ncbi:MAG: hypothetical protein HYR48_02660 [Gemmatimonadetes bacterium]|nr:hypothetical protein [Gemmatimonadota bacterium]
MIRRSLFLAFPVLVFAAPLRAQMEHAPGGPPPATLGRVDLPTSCSAAVQRTFERGVALLHSFWYEESARAFRDAAAGDTACAMAQWGVAMTYLHPLWAPPSQEELRTGAAAVERARALHPPTPLERDYVEAIGAFYRDYATARHRDRLVAYSDAMRRMHATYPDDGEAAMLYALSLLGVAQNSPPDTTYVRQREAGAILEPLFQRQPNHPGLAHYLIHSYDAPALAREGTRAANRYAGIAPSVPHARHMPSHIYIRLGMWDAAIASNISSAAAARQYEAQQRWDGAWDQRLHAMDYMAYGYLQQGRDAQARRLVDEAAGFQRTYPPSSLTSDYALAAIPARYAVERGQWAEAAALPVKAGAPPAAAAVTHFAKAIGAARRGDTALARAEVAALAAIDDDLTRRQVPVWAGMVHAQRLAAESWLALATRDTARAVQVAAQAADLEDVSEKHPVTPGAILPARELQGDLLLEVGRAVDAMRAYQAALALQPKRARSLAGAARAAELAGDRAAARTFQREYRTLMARSNRGRTRD